MNFSSYGIRELLVAAGFGIATSMDVRTMMQTPKFMRGALALRREDLTKKTELSNHKAVWRYLGTNISGKL